MSDIYDKLARELDAARDVADAKTEPVELTEDDTRNGWTVETLTEYIAERNAGAELKVDPNSAHRRMARRPRTQNSAYSPFRWR